MSGEPIAVDTSALVAMLMGEPEKPQVLRVLSEASEVWLGAPTLVELSIVVARKKGTAGLLAWDALRERFGIGVVAFTAEHAELARQAWIKFGKGKHSAGLNLGDCYSYAVARGEGLPLLFVGQDFAKTDVAAVPLR